MNQHGPPSLDSRIPALGPAVPDGISVDLQKAAEGALAAVGNPATLTVVVNDPQRHTDSRSVLKVIAERVGAANIRVLVATGSHQIPDAQRQVFQQVLAGSLPLGQIAWHDCRSEGLVSIGKGWRGHRWLVDQPALLAVGSVEPHYFAGFTGAHKTLTIGCASYGDIEQNHAAVGGAKSRPCRLSGNPVYQGILDMLAALGAARPLGAVNLVQAGAKILAAAGGGVAESLQAAIPAAKGVFVRRIGSAAKAMILEVTGPLAGSFYQADKAIKNNEWAVRDRGVLVLAADCPDGLGQPQFADLLRRASSYTDALEIVNTRGYRLGDHKAVLLRYLTDQACRGVKVFLVSDGIAAGDARILGMTKVSDVAEALSAASIAPGDQGVYRVLDAGNLCVQAGG